MSGNRLKSFWLRLALIPVLTLVIIGSLATTSRSADAATVGDCATVTYMNPNTTSFGKIRWVGMSQCFAINLKGGHNYTFTTEVGPRSEAWSSDPYSMLGDSVMELWVHKDGIEQLQFDLVAWNDDYNAPATYGSQITFTAPGNFGEEKQYVIRVRGYGSAIGRYSVTASEHLVASPSPCMTYYGC